MFNVNCIYAIRKGSRIICNCPDRKLWLWIFRRSCMEPYKDCSLKIEFKKPNSRIFTPPPAKMEKYMMATKATHKLGEISSNEPDLCIIYKEDDENYIGNWVTGFGFVNVCFPKSTTRELTPEEIKHYNSMTYQIADHPPIKMKVD